MILGIDYGRAKIGFARADGSLAEPWKVIRVMSFEDAIKKTETEIKIEQPDLVVVGVSEGKMEEEQEKFAKSLSATFSVVMWDEGLSTQDAQSMAVAAGVRKARRREMEDAYAASVMLQSYLNSQSSKF